MAPFNYTEIIRILTIKSSSRLSRRCLQAQCWGDRSRLNGRPRPRQRLQQSPRSQRRWQAECRPQPRLTEHKQTIRLTKHQFMPCRPACWQLDNHTYSTNTCWRIQPWILKGMVTRTRSQTQRVGSASAILGMGKRAPPARGSGECCKFPSGVWVELWLPNGFPARIYM